MCDWWSFLEVDVGLAWQCLGFCWKLSKPQSDHNLLGCFNLSIAFQSLTERVSKRGIWGIWGEHWRGMKCALSIIQGMKRHSVLPTEVTYTATWLHFASLAFASGYSQRMSKAIKTYKEDHKEDHKDPPKRNYLFPLCDIVIQNRKGDM